MLLILLCCCVDIFYTKFRFCETITVGNSVTGILLIETLINLELLSVDLSYTYENVLG